MNIVVLAGGLSPERDVSLSSGALIANALLDNGHGVLLLDLYLGLQTGPGRPSFQTGDAGSRFIYSVPAKEPDLARLKAESGLGDRMIGPSVLDCCAGADVTFIALHGSIGENGQLQAVFDTHGIRYTGSGHIGSLLAMDKDLAKKMMVLGGVRTPGWHVLADRAQVGEMLAGIRFPCVVKPSGCGSSVGVTMVGSQEELSAALTAARLYDDAVLVEDRIRGREFSVGILDGTALPVIEIIPHAGFYDYRNKYQAGLTQEDCPARIGTRQAGELQEIALTVHRLLRLGYYSRIDFIMDATGQAFCLEANTLPGMTPTSLLPQEAAAAGIPYGQLCEMIAQAGYRRQS